MKKQKVNILIEVDEKTTYSEIVQQFYEQMDKWLKDSGDINHALEDGLFMVYEDIVKVVRNNG